MADVDSTGNRLCCKCGQDKALSEFPSVKGKPKGRVCAACVCIAQNARRANRLGTQDKLDYSIRNQSLKSAGLRECKVCSGVLPLAAFRKKGGSIALRCTPCANAALRDAYAANKNGIQERLSEHGKKRRKVHGQRLNDQKRAYVAENRALVSKRQGAWARAKLASDPMFALKKRIRSLISNSFASVGSSKNKETQSILGCTFDAFRLHIERQFTRGMCWERMGREIHIDHIIPLATAKCEQDVIALNHFTNLRPMWAKENIGKGARMVALL